MTPEVRIKVAFVGLVLGPVCGLVGLGLGPVNRILGSSFLILNALLLLAAFILACMNMGTFRQEELDDKEVLRRLIQNDTLKQYLKDLEYHR